GPTNRARIAAESVAKIRSLRYRNATNVVVYQAGVIENVTRARAGLRAGLRQILCRPNKPSDTLQMGHALESKIPTLLDKVDLHAASLGRRESLGPVEAVMSQRETRNAHTTPTTWRRHGSTQIYAL